MTDPTPEDKERAKALEKQGRRVQMLRETNTELVREIQSFGQDPDLATARLEAFAMYLEEQGFFSPEQRLEEQEKWERSLKPQLVEMRNRIRDAIKAAQARREAMNKRNPDKKLMEPGREPVLKVGQGVDLLKTADPVKADEGHLINVEENTQPEG